MYFCTSIHNLFLAKRFTKGASRSSNNEEEEEEEEEEEVNVLRWSHWGY